jgi:hypothetical protein
VKKTMRLICVVTLMAMAGQSNAAPYVNDETQAAAEKLGALKVSELTHKQGQSILSKDELQGVKDIVQDAAAVGKVEEVKIISWADREYPGADQKASSADVKLAEERANHIKKYVKDTLRVKSVTTNNMAKRPNAVQEIFETSQAKVKAKLESTGAAPSTQSETGFLGFKGKASESLILVYVKR